MADPILFSGSPIDRSERARRDPAWVKQQLESEDSRFLPMWRLKPLVKPGAEPALAWARSVVLESMDAAIGPVLLGIHDGVAHFAVDLSHVEDPEAVLGVAGQASFEDVMAVATALSPTDASILAHARTRIDWHARHRFCPACGEPSHSRVGGLQRVCEGCDAEHFPRTDPVAIAVVEREGRCLLGRQRMFPPTMFSALAGFVESGETLEEAVRREIDEEAGIKVGEVRYLASQPWPFPSSLMLGCIAHALTDEIDVDPGELEDARWFDRETVRRALAGEGAAVGLMVPPPMAIAHHLLRAWLEE